MNEETYKSLKEVAAYSHQQLNLKKRLSTEKYHMLVALAQVEGWIHETAKEYEETEKQVESNLDQKIIEISFGYDMTINTYFLILEENDKTAIVQEVGRMVNNDTGMGAGTSVPDTSKRIGEPFRAYKRVNWDGRAIYRSKFNTGYVTTGDLWDGKPSYYNTWD